MTIEDTLDAFVDGETVDTSSLDAALASPEGRAYLIDALALRRLVESTSPHLAAPRAPASPLAMHARVAAFAIACAGLGYVAGLNRDTRATDPVHAIQTIAPPEPTRVIELTDWQESKGGD